MAAKRDAEHESWRSAGELWDRVDLRLPKYRPGKHGGRPRVDRRPLFDGMLCVLRTGCQWNAAPRELGSSSTLHRCSPERIRQGVFLRLWKEVLRE